jgi:phytoene dehydrogenase-like protein
VSQYDIVVIGGGHNGLIAAAYLSKAGLNVCVLEIQDQVGGSSMTRELTLPGFKHDWGSVVHIELIGNPLLKNDELGLKSKYGLKYVKTPAGASGTIFPDNRALFIYPEMDKTCESIAQFSKRDAEVFPKFCEFGARIMRAADLVTLVPPPSWGAFVSSLETSEDGREYLKALLSSPMDIAEDWFESGELKVVLCHAAHVSLQSPTTNGTGVYIYGVALRQSASRIQPASEKGREMPGIIAQGGSGSLSNALVACIKDNGGTVLTSKKVKSVKVQGGEARGVILDSGEEIIAKKGVVSAVNVKQLFLDMLKPENLPSGFQDKVKRLKHGLANMDIHLAIENPPKYTVGGEANTSALVYICPTWDEYLEASEGYRRGIPSTKELNVACFSKVDPTRAPAGKHTIRIAQFQPYSLKDGGAASWDVIKEEVADGIMATLRKHTSNMGKDNILGRCVVSPLDYERANPSTMQGDPYHIHIGLSQLLSNRPLPGWSHYKTPVKNLYMCGTSVHPGGGVKGNGRVTAQVMMEEFGIDFKKAIG